jgi:hypothetical protein
VTFKAPAGHGYELTGTGTRVDYSPAELEEFTEPGAASYAQFILKLERGDGEALYAPMATLSGGRLEASLGALGDVSLRFVPHRVEFRPPYKRCRGDRARIEHGAFVGNLRFDGEGGYAHLRRTRIAATLTRQPHLRCNPIVKDGSPRGTRVGGVALAHGGRASVAFTAMRRSPAGAGRFTAFTSEQRGHASIERTVEVDGPAGTLDLANDLSAATVEPPTPFSGSATFTADPGKQSGSWLGDLSVSFPGRPDVRLAGARFEGSVLKPGQCSVNGNVSCVSFSRGGG